MMNQSTPIINHYVALVKVSSFENCLNSVEKIANSIATDLNLNIVKKASHMFEPQGITLIYVLSQSHLMVHTWPELGVIHVDLITCSYRSREKFEKCLKHALNGHAIDSIQIKSIEFDKLDYND